jgi:hypothetical protein
MGDKQEHLKYSKIATKWRTRSLIMAAAIGDEEI